MITQNSRFGMGEDSSLITKSGADKFPNPFCDIASEYIPKDMDTIFECCEYLMLSVVPFKAVSQQVVRYFLTEIELQGGSDEEREDCELFLDRKLKIMRQLSEIGDDYMTYGQAFVSLYFPFERTLTCPECFTMYHIEVLNYKFDTRLGTFTGDCPKCKKAVEYTRRDNRSLDPDKVKIVRWSPKDIRLRYHPISGKTEYYLKLDQQFVQKILDANPFYLNDTQWSMIEAILAGKDDGEYLFKFKEDSIYHMKAGTLSGLPVKGWAIPPILSNFKLAYYIQLMRRYDEAIALDFIVPFRILHPKGAPQGQDPLMMMSMSNFIGQMRKMVQDRRKDLTSVQVSPVEIGYQMLGGEAKALAPKENIELASQELMNAMGFPMELWKGSLNLQTAPVAMRLFEKTWGHLVDGFNDIIDWTLTKLSKHFLWGEISGKMRSVTLADDIERKALALQAAAGMDISKATAYRPLGIDYLDEQRRVLEEQEEIQRLQQESMERQEAQQAEPPPSEDGAPALGGGTPGDVHEQAKALAHQLLVQTPETMRRGELIKIKHSNPTLHALVKQYMDEMRYDMQREGGAMMMEQARQGG